MENFELKHVWGVIIYDPHEDDGVYLYDAVAALDDEGYEKIARIIMERIPGVHIGGNCHACSFDPELEARIKTILARKTAPEFKKDGVENVSERKECYEFDLTVGANRFDVTIVKLEVNAGYEEYRAASDPEPVSLHRGDKAFFAADVDQAIGVFSSEPDDLKGLCYDVTL